MMFVVSDTHFFDQNMLGIDDFAPRPFEAVEEMNNTIVKNWNSRVSDDDVVFHLGDIAVNYTKPPHIGDGQVLEILQELNGRLVLVKGNHDRRDLFKWLAHNNYDIDGKPKFEFHDVGKLIKYNHQQLYMTHYPMMLGIAPQILNLHGHIHHYMVPSESNINVGVDAPELDLLDHRPPFGAPILLREVDKIAVKKQQLIKKTKSE